MDLGRWLGNYKTIVRAMPNTPAQIQAGVTGLYAMPSVSKTQIALADQVLSAAGTTLWLDCEEKLDAVTAISGSGPAYVFYFIEALQEAALNLGLSEAASQSNSALPPSKAQVYWLMPAQHQLPPCATQVTSKGGTTEQGVLSLENSKVKQAIILAAQKACERAKTLGIKLGQMS